MTIDRLKSLVSADFDDVIRLITDKIQGQSVLIDSLSQHIVQSGGKRVRPLLVLLAAHACDYRGKEHIILAAMVEIFHTATLLHDDVVDGATLRRGRKTANQIWGSKASVLVGDYLYTYSLKLIADIDNKSIHHLLANTAHEISCGEIQQLTNRDNIDISVDNYVNVIRAKTAVLFAASATIGGLLTNADKLICDSLYAYGLHLGTAFQLIDDALDYSSDTDKIGKNQGTDLADGKITWPLLHSFQHGTLLQKELIRESLKGGSIQDLEQILTIIDANKSIEFTRNYAKQEIDLALVSLQILPDTTYKNALRDLAYFALQRDH